MKILLVSATEFEIEPFLNNKDINILICGIGSPDTIYHLTKKLFERKYDLVIQAGIAGTYSKNIQKGETIIIQKDVFADIGVEEKGEFKTIFQLGCGHENKFPYTAGWLNNDSAIIKTLALKKVSGVTVNKITDSKKHIRQIIKVFNPDIESMEGAACHFVCLQQNIPFIQIRSISNKVGERNKAKWKIKKAIINLHNSLQILLTELNKNDQ